jgi:hypothetical protein
MVDFNVTIYCALVVRDATVLLLRENLGLWSCAVIRDDAAGVGPAVDNELLSDLRAQRRREGPAIRVGGPAGKNSAPPARSV